MSTRSFLDAIREEVAKYPGVAVTFGRRRKHEEAVLSYEGRTRFVTLSGSPSDGRRNLNNHLRDVRREIRNLGVIH